MDIPRNKKIAQIGTLDVVRFTEPGPYSAVVYDPADKSLSMNFIGTSETTEDLDYVLRWDTENDKFHAASELARIAISKSSRCVLVKNQICGSEEVQVRELELCVENPETIGLRVEQTDQILIWQEPANVRTVPNYAAFLTLESNFDVISDLAIRTVTPSKVVFARDNLPRFHQALIQFRPSI